MLKQNGAWGRTSEAHSSATASGLLIPLGLMCGAGNLEALKVIAEPGAMELGNWGSQDYSSVAGRLEAMMVPA